MFGTKLMPISLRELVGTGTLLVGGFFVTVWLVLFSFGTALILPQWHSGNVSAVLMLSLQTLVPLLFVTLFGWIATYSAYGMWRHAPQGEAAHSEH